MATIAFCGIGLMGSQMATRLRNAGHAVRAWNRTRARTDSWANAHGDGASACATPAEAATSADALHMMVANDEAVENVLSGTNGALTRLTKNAVVVDHSTVSVKGTEARANRINSGGWRYLHCPVLAGPSNVAKGEGLMIAGGDSAVYEAWAPVLHQIIEKHWYTGAAERDAAAFKLMANSMLFSITEALAEFYSLGNACKIPPDRAAQLFDHFDPGRTIYIRGPRMAKGDYAASFTARMAAKDADLMLEAARDGGAFMPTIELVLQKLLRLIKSGRGDLDLGALGYEAVHGSGRASGAQPDFASVDGEG